MGQIIFGVQTQILQWGGPREGMLTSLPFRADAELANSLAQTLGQGYLEA